ncbi:DUF2573 family protein [Gottfriedia sp. NPDC056225]|uniref:DUF2573 family protein n=1 Tax=Gottfriedia sp. NPDC056225 TaxID=3345751 RepID=UPI00155884EC|nr:DUF2573 family protein [Arthrobacter citreus]
MENEFEEKFDALLRDFTQLRLGDWSEEEQEKMEKMMMYEYISKSMPNLASQWNGEYSQALLKRYTELLLGDWSEEMQAKVAKWIKYTYISKLKPNLLRHWNAKYPQAKQEVVNLIREIKALNDQVVANRNKS